MTSALSSAFDLRTLPVGTDLVSVLREAGRTYGDQSPPCWLLYNQETDGMPLPSLVVGVRGEVGAVMWDDGETPLVPADGDRNGATDYFLGARDHSPFPVGCELPVNRVLDAVSEFVRTGQRPECIEWVPEDG